MKKKLMFLIVVVIAIALATVSYKTSLVSRFFGNDSVNESTPIQGESGEIIMETQVNPYEGIYTNPFE